MWKEHVVSTHNVQNLTVWLLRCFTHILPWWWHGSLNCQEYCLLSACSLVEYTGTDPVGGLLSVASCCGCTGTTCCAQFKKLASAVQYPMVGAEACCCCNWTAIQLFALPIPAALPHRCCPSSDLWISASYCFQENPAQIPVLSNIIVNCKAIHHVSWTYADNIHHDFISFLWEKRFKDI